ncbi:protein S100-B-like [Protopterus annectens]|uniref:protein S100-B-like n=1 Tax=Protopterus annectens TaxID=7888 RepID=UPI001CFC28FC|nr:protein S100-B-like [Protopterus annectens]
MCSENPQPKLFDAVGTIADIFFRYSARDGRKNTMTKKAVKELFEDELGTKLNDEYGQQAIEALMSNFDADGDCEISFEEFMKFVGKFGCSMFSDDLAE